MKKEKGYILLIVLIFSAIIALIGAGLALINKQGFLATRANIRFNKLQKAAHYGLIEAIKNIVDNEGVCEAGIFDANLDGVNVHASTVRRGLACSIRSEATSGNAKIVLVGAAQEFYGIGTLTVKANEEVQWIGGAYVSGCDLANNCSIPAIIASGSINGVPTGVTYNCGSPGSIGIYGNPPLFPNVNFYDLVPLTFNAECFYDLLSIFEEQGNYTGYPMGLGRNPLWLVENEEEEMEPIQDIIFNKGNFTSCPNPLDVDEPQVVWEDKLGNFTINWDDIWDNIPTIPSTCECDNNTLDLSDLSPDLLDCEWIEVNTNATDVTINGTAPSLKFIYVPNNTVIIDDAGNATVITNEDITINATTNSPLALYTKKSVTINGTTTMTRIVSEKDINFQTNSTLISNSTLITLNSIVNNATSKLTLKDVNVFAKRIEFTKSTTIEGGMFYLFGYVESCDDCSTDPDSSIIDKFGTFVKIGTSDNPVLFIMVNSCLRVGECDVDFNGIFFAEGPACIDYLTYFSFIKFTGISIWNAPNDFTKVDKLVRGFRMQFDYGIINALNSKYWFVRRFECIKDDPQTYLQAIQTLHSSY